MARVFGRTTSIVASVALAGSMVMGFGAGVAGAQATGTQGGTKFERTLDKTSVRVGDEVKVTSTVSNDSRLSAWLVYWITDHHPDCFEYVEGSASWTVSGKTYTEATNPQEVKVTDRTLTIDPPSINSWARPIVMTSRYTVTCAPGVVPSGGLEWDTTNAINGHATFEDAGPNLQVEQALTSVSLGNIGTAQTDVSKPVSVFTSGVANGEKVEIFDGSNKVGEATVNGGQATFQWTPTAAGVHAISAKYAGNTKYAASVSQTQNVHVAQTLEASTTTLDAIAGAKVGSQTLLRANVSPAAEGATVLFKVDNVVVGSDVPVIDGVATFGWTPSSTGIKTVVAEYSGGGAVASSVSDAQSVSVAEADPNLTPTRTTVTAPASAKVNSDVTLTASVTGGIAGVDVIFKAGTSVIGTAKVGADGKANLAWKPGSVGPVAITAEYAGDTATAASSGTANLAVEALPTDPEDPTDPTAPTAPGAGSLGSLGSLGN